MKKLTQAEKEALDFILSEFINTHSSSGEIYREEISVSEKILKSIRNGKETKTHTE
jgi:hypothetical protein